MNSSVIYKDNKDRLDVLPKWAKYLVKIQRKENESLEKRVAELGGAGIVWHEGPAEGGKGTAPNTEDGKARWYDGDTVLVIIETNQGREIVVLHISADEDCFSVSDCYGDEYSDWGPEDWSWWAKLDEKSLPEPTERQDDECDE